MQCNNISIYNLLTKEDISDYGEILVSIKSLLLCQDKLYLVLLVTSLTLCFAEEKQPTNQPKTPVLGYNCRFIS